MQIKLVFHPPNGVGIGFMKVLTESQAGLIPRIGEEVRQNGVRWSIIRKCFNFPQGADVDIDIEFATEPA